MRLPWKPLRPPRPGLELGEGLALTVETEDPYTAPPAAPEEPTTPEAPSESPAEEPDTSCLTEKLRPTCDELRAEHDSAWRAHTVYPWLGAILFGGLSVVALWTEYLEHSALRRQQERVVRLERERRLEAERKEMENDLRALRDSLLMVKETLLRSNCTTEGALLRCAPVSEPHADGGAQP